MVARFGIPARSRSLRRLFERYVGVRPKWVLRRYRIHEAAARLAEGTSGTWAEVAVELGYVDQSHFIRDVTRAVGTTSATYAEACQGVPVRALGLSDGSRVARNRTPQEGDASQPR